MAIKWSRDEKEQEELDRYIRRRHCYVSLFV